MKRLVISFCLVCVCGSRALASDFVLGFGGGFSDLATRKPSATVQIATLDYLFSISAILNSEIAPGEFDDDKLSAPVTNDLGTKRVGSTVGFDFGKKFRLAEAPYFGLMGLAGFYLARESHIVEGSTTGYKWAESNNTRVLPGIGAGVTIGDRKSLELDVTFHSLRGLGLVLNYAFR